MDKNLLQEAMNYIDDDQLTQAAKMPKKRKLLPWISAVAAVLALVLALHFFAPAMVIQAEAVTLASGSRARQWPNRDDYADDDAWRAAVAEYDQWQETQYALCGDAKDAMTDFLRDSCLEFLSGSEENLLYSPINAYIGLSVAAEMTAGSTRQELLRLLGVQNVKELREQISALWESVYQDDGNEISTLANSLWLDESLSAKQSAMDTLAYHYYCSSYRQSLSDPQAGRDIAAWINQNTGNFLSDFTKDYQLPAETILALYSTIYFQAKWVNDFNAANNTQDIFHASTGDYTCTFMHQKQMHGDYYWGDSYGAVSMWLKNGSQMWFILPDEGKTTEDVLREGQYLDMVTASYEAAQVNKKYMMINLSVPKFDIQAQANLKDGLAKMGVTELFQMGQADFSASLQETAYITAVNQSVRVAIDEKGITAAAYIEFPGAGAAMPPDEIIDFVLDRPFLFVITNADGIVLFTGTVNQP